MLLFERSNETSTASLSNKTDNSNLLSSINLLKTLIENNNQNLDIDSFSKLLALAQEKVTLSYREYAQLNRENMNHMTITSRAPILTEKTINNLSSHVMSNTVLNTILNMTDQKKFMKINKSALFISDNLKNSTASSYFSDDMLTEKSSLLMFMTFFYLILITTSVISNPLLIYILLWRRKAQIKLIDIFVANLSLSDLFLSILNIPLCLIIYFSEKWPFGTLMCQLGTFSTSCSIYVNIFTMAYISIDRYFAVTRPLHISNPRKKSVLLDNHTRHKIYLVLTLIWIISIILSIPQIIYSKVSTTSSSISSLQSSILLNSVDSSHHLNMSDFFLDDLESSSIGNGELGDLGDEDLFNKCILEYPYKNMKTYMVLVNFSLQYLIPSIVILYFYGKIIYHLYLNLNIEDLMDDAQNSHHNHQSNNRNKNAASLIEIKKSRPNKKTHKFIFKSKTTFDINRNQENIHNKLLNNNNNNSGPNLLFKSNDKQLRSDSKSITDSPSVSNLRPKRSKLRVEGLNRTRNLKKSIKIMIIIIVLFLLSWLPLHLYRLVTTFYPVITDFIHSPFLAVYSFNSHSNSTETLSSEFQSVSTSTHASSTLIKSDILKTHDIGFDLLLNKFTEKLNITYLTELCTKQYPNSTHTNSSSSKECFLKNLGDIKSDKDFKLNTLHNRFVFFACYFMAMSSVCYNPIVYFWMHKKFRAEVKLLFLNIFLSFKCRKNVINNTRYTMQLSHNNKNNNNYTTTTTTTTNNLRRFSKTTSNLTSTTTYNLSSSMSSKRNSTIAFMNKMPRSSLASNHSLIINCYTPMSNNATSNNTVSQNPSGYIKNEAYNNRIKNSRFNKNKTNRFNSLSSDTTVTSSNKKFDEQSIH
jgi:hypothetical protein